MKQAKFISDGINTYAIIGERGPQGEQGRTGPQGEQGLQGPQGEAAPTEIVKEATKEAVNQAINDGTLTAYDDTELKKSIKSGTAFGFNSIKPEHVTFIDKVLSGNLLQLGEGSGTYRGVTVTVANNVVTLNGTSTGAICIKLSGEFKIGGDQTGYNTETINTLEVGSYYGLKVFTTVNLSASMTCGVKDTSGNTMLKSGEVNELTSAASYLLLYIYDNNTFDNVELKFSIEKDVVPTEYKYPGDATVGKIKDEFLPINVQSKRTEDIAYSLVQKAMDTAGKYTDSTFTVAVENKLKTVIGERYRVTVNPGFVIMFNKDKTNYKYQTRMMEFEAWDSLTGLCIQKQDKTDLSVSDADTIGLKIEHVLKRNTSGVYDMIVAASNSSEFEKAQADLVCDGVNDEVEIQCAVNCNLSSVNSARVLLMSGDYNIDNFYTVKNDNNSLNGRGTVAIQAFPSMVDGGRYSVTLEGKYYGHFSKNSGTRLLVSDACVSALENNKTKEYAVIGAYRNTANYMGELFDLIDLNIERLLICTNGVSKPIIGVDGAGCSQIACDNIGVTWCANNDDDLKVYFDTNPPVDGSIGVRGPYGSNRGKKNYIKHSMFCGLYEGIAITGEHFIIEDNLEHHCYYGFSIGNYAVRPQMEHPNIFIGNSMEQCYCFALLNRFGATEERDKTDDDVQQTLIYIGGSTEDIWTDSTGSRHNVLPIKEVVKGAYRGYFETDWRRNSKLFEDGSGTAMLAKNYKNPFIGEYDNRPWNCHDGCKYIDTTNHREITCFGGKWYTADGTQLS